MRKVTFITVVALLAALFAAPAMAMTLTSSSFKDGGAIGMKYVCPGNGVWPDGENISPQLTVADLPSGTNYIAVVMDDTTASNFIHWAFIVESKYTTASEDVDLSSVAIYYSKELTYADSKNGYRGPYPPKDSGTHTYVITAYALKNLDGLDTSKELAENIAVIKTNAIDKASITGKYPYEDPEDPKASWKLQGTWNYTANVPKQTIEIEGQSGEISGNETGTIVANMTTGEDSKEYYDTMTMTYTGTYTVTANGKTQTGTESGTDEPIAVQKVAYTPGDAITYSKAFEIEGVEFTERLECYQTEENKIEGKLYLYQGDTLLATGDVTATRPTGGSSSSGGCNAGVAAAMLVFCGLPMFFRKKN